VERRGHNTNISAHLSPHPELLILNSVVLFTPRASNCRALLYTSACALMPSGRQISCNVTTCQHERTLRRDHKWGK
jgi:hypothetical protein